MKRKQKKKYPGRLNSALIKFINKECFIVFLLFYKYWQLFQFLLKLFRNQKKYLRNTMSHDRLNGLALMDTHAEIELDLNELIDLFQPTP